MESLANLPIDLDEDERVDEDNNDVVDNEDVDSDMVEITHEESEVAMAEQEEDKKKTPVWKKPQKKKGGKKGGGGGGGGKQKSKAKKASKDTKNTGDGTGDSAQQENRDQVRLSF